MKLQNIIQGLDVIKSTLSGDMQITSITSDSRNVTKGSLFVCIKGAKSDGHDYISQAMEKGAVGVVVSQVRDESIPYMLVENTRKTLALMLDALYEKPWQKFKRVIGITGTNGKTTTSLMLKAIFERAGYKVGLIGTLKYLVGDIDITEECSNNILTTPDSEVFYRTISKMLDMGADCLIMEVSSHALELCKIDGMHFDIGLFTNFTRDHLDLHKSLENYLNAKAKLFEMCDSALLNFDDSSYPELFSKVKCEKLSYSAKSTEADYSLVNLVLKGAEGIRYELLAKELLFRINVKIPGIFTAYNSLCAASCALKCGIPVDTLVQALAEMEPVKGRIDRVDIPADYSVIIDFAHTPDALTNVIGAIRGFCQGRLITLFGCGGDRDRTKRPIMGKIAMELSDSVIITCDNSRKENEDRIIDDILSGIEGMTTPYKVIKDRKQAIRYAMDIAQAGDIILLAGKGHEEYQIDSLGKHPFSEREIVKEYFEEKNVK